MSRSYVLFDAMFDLAHLLKVLSYTCVLVGLLANMFHLFRRVESSAREIEQTNMSLRESISQRIKVEENLREANAALESRARELERSRSAAFNVMRDAEDARQTAQQAEQELENALEIQQDAMQRQAGSIRQLEFAHQELQEQKQRYQGILENVVDAVINISEQGIIEDFNPAAEQMFGYTAKDVLGKNISLLMPSPYREEHDQHLHRYRSTGRKSVIGSRREAVGLRKNGMMFPIQLSISEVIMTSADNETSRFFSGIVRDLTQRKEAEAQLLSALDAAEAATKSKSEFLANMSHEIRTPMTAILGFAEILLNEEGVEFAPKHRLEMFRTIQRNGEYLLELINDILDLSKIESAKVEVENIEFSPRRILSEVATLMRVRASAKGLPLETEFDGPIPEHILSDPTRLRQILINLIGNAIKFSETGKIRVLARLLDADSDAPRLQFDVIDTGIGMTEEQIDKLFQPFSQADTSTTRKFGGTGLGLTISKRLSEMLGGEIRVQSTPGEGSTFSVTISTGPLAGVKMVDHLSENEISSEQLKKRAVVDVRLDCRVLLAEDGPDNQRLISFILKKAGADVEIAENGQIAFDLALSAREAENPFDVILMDMQMPVLDGYAATGQLREAGYTGTVIALTAHAMSNDREKCLNAGCDDYIAKPIDRRKLISLVAEYAARQTTPGVCNDGHSQQKSQHEATQS
ncbi:MAG: PAS domain S-box protein [Planctomycetes bacterium]|nr:PAS domain S-box protein [Planctomycetota bacterium]